MCQPSRRVAYDEYSLLGILNGKQQISLNYLYLSLSIVQVVIRQLDPMPTRPKSTRPN